MSYAEVIGDPIAQSKSPLIHKHWLETLGLQGDYLRTLVPSDRLPGLLAERREDRAWRGCNVTIPHKESAAVLVDQLDAQAAAIGAVNCIVPAARELLGFNTDVDGIAAALDGTMMKGERAIIIGAGGAARSAVAYLSSQEVDEIILLLRDPARAQTIQSVAPETTIRAAPLNDAASLLGGASVIVNASPMGMAGSALMPELILEAVSQASQACVFDMVYDPLETAFLRAGSGAGARTVDGLTMLIGQAARAFELFFGAPAPQPSRELRDLLTTA
jgi:shikimate dehydrogenase